MWSSCHLTSKQRFLWLPSCSFLFKTTHSLSHPNKTNVKSFKQVQIIDRCCQENSGMHFRTGNDPNGPNPAAKKKRLYIITYFFLFTFMCIAFSLRVNGRHEVAVIYRDEYFGLKLSPTSPTILHPSRSTRIALKKKIITQNTKAQISTAKNHNHKEVDRHTLWAYILFSLLM